MVTSEGVAGRHVSGSEEDTIGLGRRLGEYIRSHPSCHTVFLYGDLGSGKTTMVKGIASAFGIAERDVCSASFVLVAEYESSPPLYHIDLYRLGSSEAIDDIGIVEYIGPGGIAIVEWPELLDEEPAGTVKVRIRHLDERSREVMIEGIDDDI